jgi:hypothetical protein
MQANPNNVAFGATHNSGIPLPVFNETSRNRKRGGTVELRVACLDILAYFIMVCTGGLVGMLYFVVKVFQPFSTLWKGPASASASIARNSLSFTAILQSFRHREIAMLAIGLVAAVIPFLTIASAGLFRSEPVSETRNIHATQLDWFKNDPVSRPET